MPDVSVIIPTYNRRSMVQQAIESCFEGKDGIDVEVVVVDDGSTDGTRKYLENLDDDRVRPIFQEHQGGQVARNRGLSEAQGKYVKFLDDDDWLKEGALRVEFSALEESNADISYGPYEFISHDGSVASRQEAPVIEDPISSLLASELLTHIHRFTYRSSLLSDVSWDLSLPCRQDVDFILQASTKDPEFVRVEKTVGCLRRHEGKRVAQTAGCRDDVDPPYIHASILLKAIRKMENEGTLNRRRKRAAAQGLWKWAHILAAQDLSSFREVYNKIQQLHPGSHPHRTCTFLSILDTLIGPKETEYITYTLRKMDRLRVWLFGIR